MDTLFSFNRLTRKLASNWEGCQNYEHSDCRPEAYHPLSPDRHLRGGRHPAASGGRARPPGAGSRARQARGPSFQETAGAAVHEGPARQHHPSVRRADLETRKAGAWRPRRSGLSRRSRAHARTSRRSRPARNTATTASAIPLTSPSATWCSTCRIWKSRASPSRKSSTATSSSPPAPADPAASACTKPNIAWRCATPGSTVSACCCSSSPAGSASPTPKPAWR